MAVTSDASLEKVFDLGIRRDTYLILQVSNSSYVIKQIFKDHILINFIEQVEKDRKFVGMDNCSCHLDEELLQILAQNMILVITYPSHTSHVFQVLDLLLFGVLKVHKKYIRRNDTISPKIDHLYRIFQAYEQSTCSTTIRSSFTKAVFDNIVKDGLNYLKLNRNKIENSPNFKEIWDFNYPEEKITPRRRNQKEDGSTKSISQKNFNKSLIFHYKMSI